LLKILLGVFIPLIIIILLLVLLYIFRKRIPFFKHSRNKGSPVEDVETPAPIPIENFSSKVKELNANNGFQELFQAMGTLTTSEFEGRYRLTKVAGSQNGCRNRYCDMVPYDQSFVLVGRPWSAVMRDPQPQPTVEEVREGYINASYVRRPEYGSGGEALVASVASLPEYIATQGPRENTVADFLTMVCQQRSPCIIMLCQCMEGDKEKCSQYWPNGSTQTFQSENCSVMVEKESEESIGNVVRRQLKIHASNEASPWTVTQFHFMDWADYNIPNMDSLYNFINMQNNFLATHSVGTEYGPTVVHCSAGVGRTGTFMAARFLLDRLRKNPQNVDIIGTVLAMRKWRRCLVQITSQLQFLYNFIDFCLVKENLGVKPVPSSAVASAEYQNAAEHPQSSAVDRGEYANPQWPVAPPTRNGETYYLPHDMF
uniref:Protein-tyrosine-phosphatase n=1 Tax=Taenia asiatica TaxID=60517 RepID=A0A0R3WFX5_TAEAS